jgi:hypothetical protein
VRADQFIILGGTLNGKRIVSNPLPANDAIPRYYAMRLEGYSQITMTDANTGRDYNVGNFLAPAPEAKQ